MTDTPPVALISFNRPDVTRRTLQAIREAAPAELFLIADGPRPGNEDDAVNCEAVRAELDAIDWPCQVRRRYNDVNRGLDPTIELGLDWVFDQVEDAVILEDDCLPNADFFRFCAELLDRHRDNHQVWQIASRAPTLPGEVFGGASYAFAASGPIWGWATWRRAWSAHRRRFPRSHDGPSSAPQADLNGSLLQTAKGRRYFADVAADHQGKNFRWDSYWCLSCVSERGLFVIPRANLVENIGFGEQATNTRTPLPQRELEPMQWPLTHPTQLTVNPEIELLVERLAAAYHGRLARFVAKRLAKGPVRDAVRATVGVLRDRLLPVE